MSSTYWLIFLSLWSFQTLLISGQGKLLDISPFRNAVLLNAFHLELQLLKDDHKHTVFVWSGLTNFVDRFSDLWNGVGIQLTLLQKNPTY